MTDAPASRFRPVKVLALVFLVAAAGAGVFIFVRAASRAKPPTRVARAPAPQSNKALEEARRALAALQEQVRRATTVTDELIAEAYAAGIRWNSAWSGQESPLDKLASALVLRRADEAATAFAALQARVDSEMTARRYGAALETIGRFHPDPPLEDALRDLTLGTLDRIDTDLSAVEEQGAVLVEARRFSEASRWFAQQAPRFQGTDRHGRVAGRPDTLAELARADEARQRREDQEARVRVEEAFRKITNPQPVAPPSAPGTPAPAGPPLSPFLARFCERVNQDRLAKHKYEFPAGISGTPTAASATGLTVGGATIAWAGLSVELLVAMANDAFHGEDFVVGAEYAYAAGLTGPGDRFLWRYLGVPGDRKQRQAKIDETLARLRGLRAVPDGGFTYDAKAGWEDKVQRANRTAVDEAARHIKALLTGSDARRREEAFDKLRLVYLQAGLADQPREKIRVDAVAALKELKRIRLEEVSKKAKAAAGLAPLRTLKLALNERREEALKVIYDPKIYLPEDDPRWAQGDKANGQDKVDELVERVRELWEKPGRIIFENCRAIERDIEELRVISERYLAAFGEESDPAPDLSALDEVRNNLNEVLSVKSFCVNGGERSDYDWNRRVDRYNEGLKDAGVTRDEIEHAKTVNDYREMMGRRRVFLDARLCRATKKHSGACDRAGKIWHVGSDGDPQSRARAEGFSAGVAENVAIGYSSPAEIWTRGWYRASDHHRNGLNEHWNCMGYGYVGRVGTQNFSAIGPPKGF
ncbi:MAG TPA: CAP domain-containing protein [Planctomycetota bacterium]